MPYCLTHPEHGIHICYNLAEVEAHKAIGWVLADEAKPATQEPKAPRQKPGRKPKK